MVQVDPIKAFSDNYIWALKKENKVWVVDPGQAEPVFDYLKQTDTTLAGILITHHHWDHTNGVEALLNAFKNIPVYGPAHSPFEGISHKLNDSDEIIVADTKFKIISTPGHTLDHICYINDAFCFTGDTLFSAGCGRLFEGDAEMMWHSLAKFDEYSDDTLIYCTHEYTQANLRFALAVEPNNANLLAYTEKVQKLRDNNQPSLPTHFGLERAVNPFLRASEENSLVHVPKHLIQDTNENWQKFAALRAWKDEF
jgi:hydroxyacylglutathione hydrolase